MKRILLIRHAESEANIRYVKNDEEYIFDGDIPLTNKGITQSNNTGLFLKEYFDKNKINKNTTNMWVSPYIRTRSTAAQINKHTNLINIKEDPRIVEMDFGLFDQRDLEDCKKIDEHVFESISFKYKTPLGKFFARRPNGESPSDVYNRISTFLESVYRDNDETIIIVSHGITLNTLVMRLFHHNPEWYFKEPNPKNASVRLIEKNNGKLEDKGYIFEN